MKWIWDEKKNRINLRKHGLDFETAQLAFRDPFAFSRPDPHPDGDRWQTMGMVDNRLLFVVHTWPNTDDETGRIISARKANTYERKAYEDGSRL